MKIKFTIINNSEKANNKKNSKIISFSIASYNRRRLSSISRESKFCFSLFKISNELIANYENKIDTIEETELKPVTQREKRCNTIRKGRRENIRAILMLITVCLLFLITELSQFIFILMASIDLNFFKKVYLPFGNLIDLIIMIINSITFFLYCSMSNSFRRKLLNKFTYKKRANS